MRTDVTTDKKLMKLPNASTLGFGKWKAQFGDMVRFTDENGNHMGRIAGRVKDGGILYAIVIVLFDACYVGERWVKPEEITYCITIREKHQELMRFFMSDEWLTTSPDELRSWAESGYASPSDQESKTLRDQFGKQYV
jgi:hypothetical protein